MRKPAGKKEKGRKNLTLTTRNLVCGKVALNKKGKYMMAVKINE